MAAQGGSAVVLGYGPQGTQQPGAGVLLQYAQASTSKRLTAGVGSAWHASATLRKNRTAPMAPAAAVSPQRRAAWAPGQTLAHRHAAPWVLATRRDRAGVNRWPDAGLALDRRELAPWGLATRADDRARAPWGRFERQLQHLALAPWGVAKKADEQAAAPWAGPMALLQHGQVIVFPRAVPGDRSQRAPWTRYSQQLAPSWGVVIPVPIPGEPLEALFVVPVREVYMQVNTATLTRVANGAPLHPLSFNLGLDFGSWVWGFDASLPATELAAVEPVDGLPVELEATINGAAYRLVVDSISRDRAFGSSQVRITGRGKAALLDAPYSPVLSFANTTARNAQQLALDVLGATEFGAAWSVNWQAVDWLVPAKAWSFNGTQIAALNAIAQAAGSYIQPHATELELQVLPQYPVAPWDWDDVSPDYELPSAVVTREAIQWVDRPRYNRVFVSGTGQGVLGQVTRTGTAGDLVAPMVTDALITAAAAARQRGIPVLANVGRIATVSLRLPVLTETGVITPGKLVRYMDSGIRRLGLVRSTQLEVGMPAIWQTIGVETHVS